MRGPTRAMGGATRSAGRGAPLALALEGSTSRAGVALGWGTRVLARATLAEQGRHAALLLPAIHGLLEEGGVTLDELEGIVVGAGPGSFTGVRVAAATARGLVRGAGLPLVPVSSLAAAAAPAPAGRETPLCVCFDARGDRVFAGAYRWEGDRLVEFLSPRATRIPDLLTLSWPPGLHFAGDGAWRHRERLEAEGHGVVVPPDGLPGPEGLLILATGDDLAEFRITPHPHPGEWEPDYLKDGRPEVPGS